MAAAACTGISHAGASPVAIDPATAAIAAAMERLRNAARRPGFGKGSAAATATLGDGLRCTGVERASVFDCDMPRAFGGEGSAPSPTTLVRAALACCLAIGYRMHAAELGIDLAGVRVDVETGFEVCGMLDPGAAAPPGFTGIAYRVEIDSAAPRADIDRLVELADCLSPVLDLVTRALTVERTVVINAVA